MPETLRGAAVDQRMGQADIVLAQMLDIAAHVVAELGPLLAEIAPPPRPTPQRFTFMKSGERPIIPLAVRAQFSIIWLGVSSSSRVFRVGERLARPAQRLMTAICRSSPS